MTQELALTVTTDQIRSWGIVGAGIIALSAILVWHLACTLVGRTVWTVVALGLLFLLWQQHTSIEASVKACDPHVLFLHLQISDPTQQMKCTQILEGKS